VRITLLSTVNRDYWAPLEVMVATALGAERPDTEVEWHVFTDEDVTGWDGWLTRMHARHGGQRASFILHALPGLANAGLPVRGRARPIMYARLLAPALLADDCPRVLYLDADMIALRPLEELWATELGTRLCACAQDLAVPTVASGNAIRDHARLGLDPGAPYFNAGVMLIDSAKWRAAGIGERALAYLAEHVTAVNLFDQEALNVAIAGRWLRTSFAWNLIASVAGRPFLAVDAGERDDYEASLRDPGIVHYAGTLKPWRNPFLRGRWFDLYRSAIRQARPAHEFEPSSKHLAQAAYDTWLRDFVYPFERAVWQARRGF
jgi:lipopolysaccharide biosynthesis glycosyltransferase